MGLAGRAPRSSIGTRVLTVLFAVISFSISLSLPSPADGARIVNLGVAPPKVSKVRGASVIASPAHARPASLSSDERFLTREKMLGARPVRQSAPERTFDIPRFGSDAGSSAATGDFTPVDASAFPNRIHGKVFLQVDPDGEGGNDPVIYTCSGTLVESARENVVFTAGHCVFDREIGDFVDNIAFVPGYDNGSMPFGVYYGYQWFTTSQWAEKGSFSYDIGLITLQQPIEGQQPAGELGTRKIAFDLNPKVNGKKKREYTVFGYPSLPSPMFDGETLRGCRSAFHRYDRVTTNLTPYPIAIRPCAMQQGASGGGWVTLGNYLSSVTSYGYCDDYPNTCGTIFGPRFSNAAKALYTQAPVGGSPRPTLKLLSAPPRVVRKRKVRFRFGSNAATLPGFTCRLDRQRKIFCSPRISISKLRPGKHTLRVRAIDQTGKLSRNTIVRDFWVKLPRR